MSEHRTTKVMGICTYGWPFAARIPIEFSKAGCRVAMVSPKDSALKQVKSIHEHFSFRPLAPSASVKLAIDTWSPDFLVCFDDPAVWSLHRIYKNCQFDSDPNQRRVAKLIEFSLGHPSHFATLRSNSAVIKLAQSMHIRCPKTTVLNNQKELKKNLYSISYPIILKADGSEGGRGVRLIKSEDAVFKAVREFLLPMSWPSGVKRLTSRLVTPFHYKWASRWRNNISLQQYIVGHPANRAVACWNGKVLAGISVEAVATVNEFGPATVVRIIDNAEMTAVTEQMIKRLHLSGFIGFDFMIDRENAAWFLEINPRVTPVAHLDSNLSAEIVAKLGTGLVQCAANSVDFVDIKTDTIIALFPHGRARSQSCKCLQGCYYDLPRDEPDFVRTCLEKISARCSHDETGRLTDSQSAGKVSDLGN